jgi:hypothetical protein
MEGRWRLRLVVTPPELAICSLSLEPQPPLPIESRHLRMYSTAWGHAPRTTSTLATTSLAQIRPLEGEMPHHRQPGKPGGLAWRAAPTTRGKVAWRWVAALGFWVPPVLPRRAACFHVTSCYKCYVPDLIISL